MAETILNTRIKLRYASHVDWISSPVILLPGEVALCQVASNNMEVPNSSPTVMFKVGDGVHLFKELPWASARASDVYDWAKKDRIDVERLGTGNVVSSIA